MSEQKILRFDRGLKGINVFRMSPSRQLKDGLTVHHVEAVVKYGEARERWVTFDICQYGRATKKDQYGPLSVSRTAEDTFVVESSQLHPCLPRDTMLLVGVPGDLLVTSG